MTKQKEIRLILYSVKIGQTDEDFAIKALDKLGVAIKVGRELPNDVVNGFRKDMDRISEKFISKELTYDAYVVLSNKFAKEADKKLTLAGYSAWESLIKEE